MVGLIEVEVGHDIMINLAKGIDSMGIVVVVDMATDIVDKKKVVDKDVDKMVENILGLIFSRKSSPTLLKRFILDPL